MDGDLVVRGKLTARLCLGSPTWDTHGELSRGGREDLNRIRDRYASRHLASIAGSQESSEFRNVRTVLAVHVPCTCLSSVSTESRTAVIG